MVHLPLPLPLPPVTGEVRQTLEVVRVATMGPERRGAAGVNRFVFRLLGALRAHIEHARPLPEILSWPRFATS